MTLMIGFAIISVRHGGGMSKARQSGGMSKARQKLVSDDNKDTYNKCYYCLS
jgi:hypothetical protein